MTARNTTGSIFVAATAFLALGAAAQQMDDLALAIDASVKTAIEQDASLQYAPGRLLVKFREDMSEEERAAAREAVGTLSSKELPLVPGLERIDLGMSMVQAFDILSQFDSVEYIEPDYVVRVSATPNDPSFPLLWGMQNMNMENAWNTRTDGSGVIIAVIDTGVDYNHEDLSGNVWTNPGEIPLDGIDNDSNGIIDDFWGADFYNNDGDPYDDHYHGTHCAGTIAGEGNNAIGVAGVAWDAQIMSLKFLGSTGSGTYSDAIDAINYAVSKGAFLSNNSWGGYGFSQALRDAFEAAGLQGHLAICAAGNSSVDADLTPMYPAAYDLDSIMSVAAIDSADNLASFSNYGLTSVDLGAPGVSIYSTMPLDTYGYLSGTSMATPHVAGLATLVWSQNPGWTFQQVKDRIMNTARAIPALTGKCVTGATADGLAALTSPGATPPDKPKKFRAIGKKRKATLKWNDVSSDETGFEIQRQKYDSGSWINKGKKTVPANAESYNWSCAPGEYRFRIRSIGPGGKSKWSKWKTVTVTS